MAATLIASACSDSSSDAGPAAAGPTDPPTTIASATTAPVATTVAPTTAAPTTTYPSLSGSTSVTPLDNPLLADPTISLDQPLRPAVHLLGPAGSTPVDLPVPNQPSVEHTLLLAGMRAESTYAVEIELLDDSGATIGRLPDTAFTTGSLPADMPAFRIASSRPDLMQPGFTLFDMIDMIDIRDEMSQTPDDGSIPPPAGWIVMVDNEGQIIWFHNEDHTIGDVRMLPDGSILYEYNDTLAKRINLRGELLDEWAGSIITGRFAVDAHGRTVADESAIKVDVESMHHEQNVLPDGTHATLSTDLRVLDGFTEPQCGEDPADFDGTYHLIGDVVVVFDPVSGDVLHEFNLFDYFDPRADPAAWNLCGLPFDFVFPNWLYRGVDNDARDWTHANAVTADEANNTLIVSVRHLDAVIGIRWKDDANGKAGDLLWHSGPLGNMTLVSGMWHRHQHAPELESDGTILLFDNGNDRPGYGTT